MEGVENLRVLMQSPLRIQLLKELRGGAATTEQLVSTFDVHRRTIVRNLKVLEDCGWVEVRQRKYSVAPPARLFLSELFDVLEQFSVASDFVQFFEHVPPTAIDVTLDCFADANVVNSGPKNPHAPLQVVRSAVAASSEIRTLEPVGSPLYMDIHTAPLAKGASVVKMVLTTDAADVLLTSYSEEMVATLGHEEDCVFVTEKQPPFGLLITETAVLICGYDDGILQSVLDVASTELNEWVWETFKRHRANAQPFEEFMAQEPL